MPQPYHVLHVPALDFEPLCELLCLSMRIVVKACHEDPCMHELGLENQAEIQFSYTRESVYVQNFQFMRMFSTNLFFGQPSVCCFIFGFTVSEPYSLCRTTWELFCKIASWQTMSTVWQPSHHNTQYTTNIQWAVCSKKGDFNKSLHEKVECSPEVKVNK